MQNKANWTIVDSLDMWGFTYVDSLDFPISTSQHYLPS